MKSIKITLGTEEHHCNHCLNSISVTGISMTSISKTSSITKMASISSSNWSSSISSVGNWGSSISSMWDMRNTMDWGSNSLGNSLDGVGAGFVNNWLVDSLVGPDRSADGLGSISWDSLEDGLSNVVSSDNWGGLVG